MTSATRSVQGAARISGCENCQARERRVVQQLDRFRERTRLSGGPRAHITSGEADLEVFPIFVPNTVQVGQDVGTITIGVRNVGTSPSAGTDPDTCIATGFTAGLRVDIEVRRGANELAVEQGHCLADGGGNRAEVQVELGEATSAGTVDLGVRVFGSGSGNQLVQDSISFEIVESDGGGGNGGGDVQPPEDDNGDNGDNGDDPLDGPLLPCFLDPNRSCARPETIAWGGAGLLLLTLLVGS